jgi:hypothetical protein
MRFGVSPSAHFDEAGLRIQIHPSQNSSAKAAAGDCCRFNLSSVGIVTDGLSSFVCARKAFPRPKIQDARADLTKHYVCSLDWTVFRQPCGEDQ